MTVDSIHFPTMAGSSTLIMQHGTDVQRRGLVEALDKVTAQGGYVGKTAIPPRGGRIGR